MKANDTGPSYYRRDGDKPQPWDVINDYDLNFFEGCIIKYILRWRHKNGIDDLQKAKHYLEKLIELEEEKYDNMRPPSMSTSEEFEEARQRERRRMHAAYRDEPL